MQTSTPKQTIRAAVEYKPGHRVIGAAVIILAGFLLLPMIFGRGEAPVVPKTQDAPTAVLTPGEETRVFTSKITPISGKTPVAKPEIKPLQVIPTTPKPEPIPEKQLVAGSSAPAIKPKPVTIEPEIKPVSKSTTVTKSVPTIDRGWVVRIGTYSVPKNAARIADKLKKKGFNPSSGEIASASGTVVTRVWVGPFETRVEAAKVRGHVERAVGEKGFIASYP